MKQPADKKAGKKPVGRPLDYTKEMGDYICELVATTEFGLLRLTELYPELPAKITINRWRHRLPEFRTQYAQAKCEQADLLAEEILDIADDARNDWMQTLDDEGGIAWKLNGEHINRSRLRIDTRKWLAAKLLPKQYGQNSEEKKSLSDSVIERLVDKLVE